MRNIRQIGLLIPQQLARPIENLASAAIHEGNNRIKDVLLVVAKLIHFTAWTFGEKPGGRLCKMFLQLGQRRSQFPEERVMRSAGLIGNQRPEQLPELGEQIASELSGIRRVRRLLKIVVVEFSDLLDLRRRVVRLRFQRNIVIAMRIFQSGDQLLSFKQIPV